jgi:asparagine synthase (glutamine-hydrolysing)
VNGEAFLPTPLEIATGRLLGVTEPPRLPHHNGATPLEALRVAVAPAFSSGRCFVTFSGGRDSSAVLAVAVDVARREGFQPPVAVTVRFRDTPGAGEPEWQELVIRHLGVSDWIVHEVEDELDVVGPVAKALLRRHGVRYPAHSCLWAFLLARAQGGTLLTGLGGDQVFSTPLTFLRGPRTGGRWPRLHDAERLAFAASPRALRRPVLRRRVPQLPWLRPAAQHAFAEASADAAAGGGTSFPAHLAGVFRPRTSLGMHRTLEVLAEESDATVVHPLVDPGFLAALAKAGGRIGFGSRTAAMHAVFGGEPLLPDALLSRERKAVFHLAYTRRPTREFAKRFDGTGLDSDLVDAERLRAEWLSPVPNFASALALQAAWLASAARDREQPVEHLR